MKPEEIIKPCLTKPSDAIRQMEKISKLLTIVVKKIEGLGIEIHTMEPGSPELEKLSNQLIKTAYTLDAELKLEMKNGGQEKQEEIRK